MNNPVLEAIDILEGAVQAEDAAVIAHINAALNKLYAARVHITGEVPPSEADDLDLGVQAAEALPDVMRNPPLLDNYPSDMAKQKKHPKSYDQVKLVGAFERETAKAVLIIPGGIPGVELPVWIPSQFISKREQRSRRPGSPIIVVIPYWLYHNKVSEQVDPGIK